MDDLDIYHGQKQKIVHLKYVGTTRRGGAMLLEFQTRYHQTITAKLDQHINFIFTLDQCYILELQKNPINGYPTITDIIFNTSSKTKYVRRNHSNYTTFDIVEYRSEEAVL